jgi:hypothetical protein
MGILQSTEKPKTLVSVKRESTGLDFSNLKPLKSASSAKNFAGYRDAEAGKDSVLNRLKSKQTKDEDEMDSDADDEGEELQRKRAEADDDDEPKTKTLLSPEDARKEDRLAEGVKKINLVSSFTCN